MAIATLIAAGRLDDRLIDRALGLLREFDPDAAFDAEEAIREARKTGNVPGEFPKAEQASGP